jgi:hypothetical protein
VFLEACAGSNPREVRPAAARVVHSGAVSPQGTRRCGFSDPLVTLGRSPAGTLPHGGMDDLVWRSSAVLSTLQSRTTVL